MAFETIIVGAGMAGLSAAAKLAAHGHKALVLEARNRIGGRILTHEVGGAAFELGPSWVWPGQPLVAAALNAHGIAAFPQYATGALLYQQADGRLDKHAGLAPMANALRIVGGPSALIDALANRLEDDQVLRQHQVTAIAHQGDHMKVFAESPDGPIFLDAKQVALAMPPRLCASLHFEPALSDSITAFLQNTPTWMAAHAKLTAVYETPFWREAGLSGDAMSRRGPLAEVHDISPREGGPYALFGFVGLDAATRERLGHDTVYKASLQQLADLFGAPALSPLDAQLQDWSTEAFTAATADKAPLSGHPAYGMDKALDAPMGERLHFISSETIAENGGLIEGALQRGIAFADHVLSQMSAIPGGDPHAASMSWDWLRAPEV